MRLMFLKMRVGETVNIEAGGMILSQTLMREQNLYGTSEYLLVIVGYVD